MNDRWSGHELRVLQFLLRDVDATTESPDALVDAAADWGANAVLINAAGVSAWYPTRLDYQRRNPCLQGDFLGAAVERAHARGLRLFARVDISKTQPEAVAAHADWLRYRADGSISTEWEVPETCFTGAYWQDCNFEILDELLGAYDVDGVFYNMYRVAHCHCGRCQGALQAAGLEGVPPVADAGDRRWRRYELWRRRELVAYTARVRDAVHRLRPDAALMVYHHQKEGWDVSGVARASDLLSVTASSPLTLNPVSPQPAWVGWPGYEAALARGLKPDRPGVVVTTTSALFASRQAAQPPHRLRRSMLQVAFQRGAVCPAIPGGLSHDDPRAVPAIAETLAWLNQHRGVFSSLESPARVALLASRDTLDLCPLPDEGELARREEWGIYLALDRARIPFDVVPLGSSPLDLTRYAVAILPDVACLSQAAATAVDRFVDSGGTIIATYLPGLFDETGEPRTRSPLRCIGQPRVDATLDVTGGYLGLENVDLREALGGTRMVGIERQFLACAYDRVPTKQDLHLLGPVANNTPEFAVVPARSGPAGLVGWHSGRGFGWHLPWRPGVLGGDSGLTDPADILGWLIETIVGPPPLKLGAPSCVETRFWLQPAQKRALLLVLNHATLETAPLTEITRLGSINIRMQFEAAGIRSLVHGHALPFRVEPGTTTLSLPCLDAFDALQFDLI